MKYPEKVPEKPTEKFAKVFTAKEYKEDLDQLGRKILEIHPNALKFISKAEFLKIIEQKKALLTDQTTYGEFTWHCSEIIASINCSHSSLGRFNQENEMLPLPLRFPLQVRWVNEKLFVIDPLNNATKVAVKDEILSINGVAVSDLIADIYRHIASQGYVETTKKHAFNTWATGMIPFALTFPTSYELVVKGKNAPVVLNTAESFKNLYRDPSIKSCGEDLCLEILEDNKTAILTIASFNFYPWNNLNVFEDFIDSSFLELAEKGVKNLIIDVRFNGGGSNEPSIYLLRHLVKQSFTYYSIAGYEGKEEIGEAEKPQAPFKKTFEGQCYFLIDGNGNSTTGHFMSMVKVLKLGTIVGEELGSNQFCSAGQAICRLSNTKLLYYVANNTHVTTATSLPDEVGILPDHYVIQSIEDYLNNKDTVKAYTIRLIQEKK
jgi:C-terminal processing protease CtpA/Prc